MSVIACVYIQMCVSVIFSFSDHGSTVLWCQLSSCQDCKILVRAFLKIKNNLAKLIINFSASFKVQFNICHQMIGFDNVSVI